MSIRKRFVFIIATLAIADLAIFLDIPVLRQILGFACFSFIPGRLILYAFKLNKLDLLKRLLLSVGLSIAFLILIGLLVNTVLPPLGISRPLSTPPLTISLSAIIVILWIVAYQRNAGSYLTPQATSPSEHYYLSPLIFPFLFPVLAVLGARLMNATGNNIASLSVLILIPIYLCFVIFLRKHIHQATYPIAIYMIAVSLLLMHGLRSDYAVGYDVHNEYYALQLTHGFAHWSISSYRQITNAVLSTALLGGIYQSLMNLWALQYVYKLVYQLLFALVPVAIYILSRKHLTALYAFLAAIFFMSFPDFVSLQSAVRCQISMVFFVLFIVVLFADEIPNLPKKLLCLLFMLGVVVSHYAAAYIAFALLFPTWLIVKILWPALKSRGLPRLQLPITAGIVALLFIVTFTWYSQLIPIAFNYHVSLFIRDTFYNLQNLFIHEMQVVTTLTSFGTEGIPPALVRIKSIIYDVSILFIILGFVVLLRERKRIEMERLILSGIALAGIAAAVILPVIYSYDQGRLFQIMLIFLAPCFVLGGGFIARYTFHRGQLLIITAVLIPTFMCGTMLLHQLWGVPASMDLNDHGVQYNKMYISDDDTAGAKWLDKYQIADTVIYGDYFANTRFTAGLGKPLDWISWIFLEALPTGDSYVYLRRANVVSETIYIAGFLTSEKVSQDNYVRLFRGRGKIYDNGGSQVYEFLRYIPPGE